MAAIYEGLCSKQIAEKFSLSIPTVNNDLKNMLHKTNTNNCSQLLQYAKNNGLLQAPAPEGELFLEIAAQAPTQHIAALSLLLNFRIFHIELLQCFQ